MKLIALDLEMNQPSNHIIQVGAVSFSYSPGKDARLLEVLDLKVRLPEGEVLSKEISDLTGILDVSGGVSIQDAYDRTTKFFGEQDSYFSAVTWGQGDLYLLKSQGGADKPNFWGARYIDAKTVMQTILISKGGPIKGGLNKSIENLSEVWDDRFGSPHNAVADAWNTARVYCFMLNKIRGEL